MQRESFKSRLGFLLVSAGCAIGIGNVWRFPYVAGQNGGGLFVLFYLIFLVVMGLPVLTMELAVGRASRKSAVQAYQALEKPGSKWHLHGWVAMFGCYMLMMYYTTVSGWMLTYFYKFLTGTFQAGMDADTVGSVFTDLLADPKQMGFWMVVTVLAGFLVCSRGLQNGLEKVSKIMMGALLILIIILAVHSFTLSGAGEGEESRIAKCYHCGNEPVLFYTESWRGCDGDLWQLYGQGTFTGRRGCTHLCIGYVCGDHVRTDYFPGVL